MSDVRVLWLTKGLGRGGAERLLVDMVTRFDKTRFTVEVAYCLPDSTELLPELLAADVPVHCVGQRSNLDLEWVGDLRRLVRERRYHIVHTHMPLPAVAARLVAPRGSLLVHTEHNVWGRYRRPTYWTNALTYGRNVAAIAVSSAVEASIRRYRLSPFNATRWPAVRTLHHGIVPERMTHGTAARAAARRLLGLPDDALVVGTVANFTPKKDQRTLLEAVRLLRRSRPDARLVMVGDGPLERELRHRAGTRGLAGAVHFLGSRDDVPAILPALDVFALSSLHEGLSIALVEAMASGLPCVGTRVGGIPEVLRDGEQGRLVPPRDPDALADAVLQIVGDRERYAAMSEAALLRARQFDLSNAIRAIETLYDGLTTPSVASEGMRPGARESSDATSQAGPRLGTS